MIVAAGLSGLILVVAWLGFLWARGQLNDLDVPVVSTLGDVKSGETVMAICGQRKVELYAAFRSEREDWVESMALAGLGFAFMPRYSVRLGGLQQRPLLDPVVERTVVVADVRGRQRPPAARLFVDDLRAFQWPV